MPTASEMNKQTKPRLHVFAKRPPSPSPVLGEKATLRINTPMITARRINSALSAGPERQTHPHSSGSRSKITSSVKFWSPCSKWLISELQADAWGLYCILPCVVVSCVFLLLPPQERPHRWQGQGCDHIWSPSGASCTIPSIQQILDKYALSKYTIAILRHH